jgi:Ca2+-dependent lipid-binding protein
VLRYIKLKRKGDLLWLAKLTVKKQTLTPTWNETVKLSVTIEYGKPQEYVVELWDQDSIVDDFIGTGSITSAAHPSNEKISYTVTFLSKTKQEEGTVSIALQYLPASAALREEYQDNEIRNPLYDIDYSGSS